MSGRQVATRAWRAPRVLVVLALLAAQATSSWGLATPVRSPPPTPTPIPEPPPAFGRVVYRAVKAGSFESLGVSMIACRHRDAAPRTLAVEFFDRLGRKLTLFGPSVVPNVAPGKKILFVSDTLHFPKRELINMAVSHTVNATVRVLSDARIIHCMAKMRFDPGARAPTYWRSMGLYRDGIGATPPAVDW